MTTETDVGTPSNFDNTLLWQEEEAAKKDDAVVVKAEKAPSPNSSVGSGSRSKSLSSGEYKDKKPKKKSEEDVTLGGALERGRNITKGLLRSKNGSLRDIPSIAKKLWNRNRTIERVVPFLNFSAPVRHSFNWIIAEASPRFCTPLWEYFFEFDSVKVLCKPLSPGIVSSTSSDDVHAIAFVGNTFGIPEENKAWSELEGLFGESIFHKIKDVIKTRFLSEAPLYTSFIIPTGDNTIKYLIYTAGYQSKKAEPFFSHNALYSALVCLHAHNQLASNTAVKKLITKGYISESGEEESARQMYLAYVCFACGPTDITPNFRDAKEYALLTPDKINAEERRSFFVDQLHRGEILRRGFIDNDAAELLLRLFLEIDQFADTIDDPLISQALEKAAGKALASYAFPTEFLPGLGDQLLSKPRGLPNLLELIRTGEVQVHKEIEPSEMQIGEQIAIGASGRVYKGKYNGEDVAIKILGEEMLNFSLDEFKREIAIMSIIKHENLIPFRGACTKSNKLMIVTQYVKGGNLHELVSDTSRELTFAVKVKISSEIAKGMAFLHSREVIHRDLKSLNVLLDDKYNVYIIDFGTSRVMDKDKLMTHAIGTVSYMAPEIFNNMQYTEKADIYSFGMLLWEIMARKPPFTELNSWNIPVAVTKGERPPIPKDWPSPITKLIIKCWDQKSAKRPSFPEIITYLQKVEQAIKEGAEKYM